MSRFKIGRRRQPFPAWRPALGLSRSRARPFEVDWREVRHGYSLLEVGDHTLWATYDAPDWRLTSVVDQRIVGRAQVHGIEGVEMAADDYEEDAGWAPQHNTTFLSLREDRGQWLGTLWPSKGVRVLRTFLDEGFDEDWGAFARCLRDTGRFEEREPSAFVQHHGPDTDYDNAGVAGVWRVTIEGRAFTCLRVLDVPAQPTERDSLFESYVTRQGREVLGRRYNGRQWGRDRCTAYAAGPPWDERFPDSGRLVVDGVTFIHWYDCLPHWACGIELGE